MPYIDLILIVRTQFYVHEDLNLGGRVVHPLPEPSELDSFL
jgi:hypothetical protein